MAKFAVTLSNDNIVYPLAISAIMARAKVDAQIKAKNAPVHVISVRKVSGR